MALTDFLRSLNVKCASWNLWIWPSPFCSETKWLNSRIIKKFYFQFVLFCSFTDYFLPLSDLIMGQKNDSPPCQSQKKMPYGCMPLCINQLAVLILVCPGSYNICSDEQKAWSQGALVITWRSISTNQRALWRLHCKAFLRYVQDNRMDIRSQ